MQARKTADTSISHSAAILRSVNDSSAESLIVSDCSRLDAIPVSPVPVHAHITQRPRHILVRLTSPALPRPLWRAYRRDDVADAHDAVWRALRHLPLPQGCPVRVGWWGWL